MQNCSKGLLNCGGKHGKYLENKDGNYNTSEATDHLQL